MKRTATILLALCATTASAADAIKPGARLASICAGCHGTNGATQGSSLPPIAGQPKDALLTKLKNFKSGANFRSSSGAMRPRMNLWCRFSAATISSAPSPPSGMT